MVEYPRKQNKHAIHRGFDCGAALPWEGNPVQIRSNRHYCDPGYRQNPVSQNASRLVSAKSISWATGREDGQPCHTAVFSYGRDGFPFVLF